MSDNKMDRRSFLGTSAKIGVAGVVGGTLLASCGKKEPKIVPLRQPGEYYIPELPDKAIDGKALKVGVIGCGGRGSGAIINLLDAADGITVTALGDVTEIFRNVEFFKTEKRISIIYKRRQRKSGKKASNRRRIFNPINI